MTSEKSYDTQQRLDALINSGGYGPWVQINPLSGGWSVDTSQSWTGAWVRYAPGNMIFMSMRANVGTATNGTVIANVPAADSLGNGLRPAQSVSIPSFTSQTQAGGNNSPRVSVDPDGTVKCWGTAGGLFIVSGWYPTDPM